MKEVIIAVLWLVMGIINYKVFEEDDILAFAICLLFAPLFFFNYFDNNSLKNTLRHLRIANVTQKVTKLLKNVKKSPLKREF